MVDGLFSCATLTGRRNRPYPFVWAGVETSDTGAEAVKPDPGSSWEGQRAEYSQRTGCAVLFCVKVLCTFRSRKY